MDISRQQFEEFIKFHADPAELEQKLKKANNGLNYADRDVDLMWINWKASRESLTIELPLSLHVRAYDYYTDGYNSGVDCCEVILESAGIKVIRTSQ
ncbi:TPA: hypothetical protein ACPZBE_000221 [Morganella morganii]|uniref:hypothetical protein n=1 Tax=Morganella morganii TaxID=582 RepID=UPI001BDA1A6F|nr:hypothetical protein [Morganella morganii]MBT0400983.1 hypothetical protein [Morganella morganii subsp. morganii]HBZ5600268.1 hypothetical protein [Morganella morganii]